ncbi:hypothetical protein Pmani_027666 [Petrolisthes manimaculis]|uniref:ATP-binding cassette sub-family B member 10, mitochondrial n=1 Tax=Petrolisthes manimaculis TaxID=1843537 RepID=A0AAE1P3U6_9EUCA|nr:hypothetical protein Pmani_027666 [Petrolisthes manimaculis]
MGLYGKVWGWQRMCVCVSRLDSTVLLALRHTTNTSPHTTARVLSGWGRCTWTERRQRRVDGCGVGLGAQSSGVRWQHSRTSEQTTDNNNTSFTHLVSDGEKFVKNKEGGVSKSSTRSEVRRILTLAKPERWTLACAIGLLGISSTVTMAVPYALGHVVDIIYTSEASVVADNLNRVCMALTAVFLTGALSNFGRVYLMSIAGQRITNTLRSSVFAAIMRQEIAFFDANKTGELINRLSADTSLVSQAVTSNISDGLRSIVMTSAGVSMMFYMSTDLAIVGMSIVPPVALLAVWYGRFVKNITKSVQDSLASATQVAEERVANMRTVRSFSREEREVTTYTNALTHVLSLAYKESKARAIFFGMTGLSGNVMLLTVLYHGGSLVSGGALSVGQLSSFLLYAAYVGVALAGVTGSYSELNKGLGASVRLFQLIDRRPRIPNHGGLQLPLDTLKGDIEFRNITFSYPSRPEATIFKDLSLSVPAGSVVGVAGSSGCGKSTLAWLLLRLYDPQAGQVTLDGTPINTLDPTWLRSIIACVSQEPVLFSNTVRENLLYGAPDPSRVTDEQLLEAAAEANALGFLRSFPAGLDTLVGERGVMLSGGQRQRLAIARAILADPRILLLDEATSALDAESESLVQEALERLMKGRTVITIAHRLSTIRMADQIAVLSEGRVKELGPYHDLMTQPDSFFRQLVERQTFTS